MVRVIMGEQNRINLRDLRGDELKPQFRRRINKNSRAFISLDERGNTISLIA